MTLVWKEEEEEGEKNKLLFNYGTGIFVQFQQLHDIIALNTQHIVFISGYCTFVPYCIGIMGLNKAVDHSWEKTPA